MNFRDYYPLGVREIAVDQGGSFAFVQATVWGDRVPKGDRSIELQFWTAAQTAEQNNPHTGELYCSGCGHWRPDDYFPVDCTRKARRGRAYHCHECRHDYQNGRYAQKRAADGKPYNGRANKQKVA